MGLNLVNQNVGVKQLHVLLVRGNILSRSNKVDEVFAGVVNDWLRARWPVVVHLQTQAAIADRLENN